MNRQRFILGILLTGIVITIFTLLHCTSPSSGGTETGDARVVVGTLFQPDGKTPAAGVLVHIRPKNTLADTSASLYKQLADTAFVITDKNGKFAFDTTLDTGTYVVEAASGNNAVLIDSVMVVHKDVTDSLPPDTLKPAGAIKGIINLSQGGDPRKVFVLAFGIDRFARVNEDGSFKFKGLAESVYDLRLISSMDDYGVVDTINISVRSGDTTVLDTIDLPFTGIPAPTGLSVSYDTLYGCAVLIWKPVAFSNLAGYIIYRNDTASTTPIRLNEKLILDTMYRDTVFSNLMDTTSRVFVYRLKIQDKEANLSPIYSKPVAVSTPSPTKVRTFIAWQVLNTLGDSASINDKVTFITSYTNATRKNIKVQWFVDNKDSLKHTTIDSALLGRDTMQLVWSAPAQHTVYSAITDNANTVWWDSTRVTIVRDAPIAEAGRDTTVSINLSVTLMGTATQKFGMIVMYKWDFNGDSTYDDSSVTSAAMMHTYTHEAAYTAIFYIRDDDGNEVTDSRKVTVTNRAPQITSIRPDTTISIKDSISLFAIATDVDGTVKEYAWDFTGDGTFEYVSVTNTSIGYRYNIAGSYNAIVRVTDDDDKVAKDTAKITVLQDAPIPNAGKDTTVSINDTVRLHGSATQRIGTIVTWEWDIGNTGTFVTLSNPDTVIIAPSLENLYYLCVLRVTDDDGNVAKDTVRVVVKQDAPVPNAGIDTILPINDTLLLHGSATQYFGTITRWEWKFGSGNWVATSGPDTFFIAPSTEQTVVCSLAVTDDDGNRNIDEAKIVLFKKVISIAGGYSNSFFIKDDGTLWACGDNEYGKFGDGTMVNQTSPIMIMSNVQRVAAGMYHTLTLKDDGSLWACGWNLFGQLCDGTTTGSTIPKKIMADVQNMAAGGTHSLILKSDGTLWACGDNFYGQLGDGTYINRNPPVQIMIDVQSIVASDHFNLILKSDGSLWPCGSSHGFSTSSTTPMYVMSNVHSMDAGESYSLILKNDATLWACGSNSSGQFGNGTTTECHTPVQVMSNVQAMAAGRSHSLVLKTDNTLWACGSNEYGQLGDGTTINRTSPVLLMHDVTSIDAGRFYSFILRTDGSLWACGNNDYGQLGDGTAINRYKPVRIIPPQ